ncbi:glycosyltransferase family 2 protein [Cobetia marina]|uniref:glycosyltransferase family 2 protein n=1 Tax=Cobetia marina TaxID=28258 RepID=UPI0025494FCF|nr:glycosyltransferase family 2 protein [Cobetia pacifica]MDI6004294.1 glycosyltransferase family 2 protein [Cobetia pacifica]
MSKVVITSCRNEGDYLLEWVAWNIYIGFDKVIVFTNNNTDNTLDVLEHLKKKGVVEYYELSPPEGARPQMYAFTQGLKWLHTNKPDWVACLDADEYIVLKEHNSIEDYLQALDFPDAVAINWKIFGTSHLLSKGKGLTPERFVFCAETNAAVHSQFKSLFRYREDLLRFHHRAIYKNSSAAELKYVFADGTPLTDTQRLPGFRSEDAYINHDAAQINHYATRSKSELSHKMSRGNGFDASLSANPRELDYLKKFDKNTSFDNCILKELEGYVKVYDQLIEVKL